MRSITTAAHCFAKSSSYDGQKSGPTKDAGNTPMGRLYSTTRHVTKDGDSGGPWFVGGKALGFTSGGSSTATLVTPQSQVGFINGTVSIKVQR